MKENNLKKESSSTSKKNCSAKLLSLDIFAQSYEMKLDENIHKVPTMLGLVSTLSLFLFISVYFYQKLDTLAQKKGADILYTIKENFYTD